MRRLIPSRALLLLALAPLVTSLLAMFNPALLRSALLLDAALVALALLDALLVLGSKVSVQRSAPDVMSLSRRNRVSLRLRSSLRRGITLEVMDDLFEAAEAPDLPVKVLLPARGTANVEYHVVPSLRGAHALGDHYLRVPSPLGLWSLQRRLSASHTVRV